jgi:hypothetical protein
MEMDKIIKVGYEDEVGVRSYVTSDTVYLDLYLSEACADDAETFVAMSRKQAKRLAKALKKAAS